MGTLFVYIIKSAFCLMVLYLPYTLLLRHERLHRINRVVLLSIVVFSFLLPSVREGWFGGSVRSLQTAVPETTYAQLLDGLQQSDVVLVEAADGSEVPRWPLLLVTLYIIGVVVSLAVRAVQFVRMYRGITVGCLWTEHRPSGAVLYCHAHEMPPFSWMRAIAMSETDLEDCEGQAILAHEEAHVRYGHSYDTLLVLVAEVLQWFNPVIWMLEADLRCIHEYQADNYVLDRGVDKKNYQLYLIKKAVGTRLQSFANGLNQSTLKNRIAMMSNKKSTKWAACRVLYLLPVGALATVAFAHPEITDRVDGQLSPVSAVKVTDLSEIVKAVAAENVQEIKLPDGMADVLRADHDTIHGAGLKQKEVRSPQTSVGKEPLVIVDGLPYKGSLNDLGEDAVQSATVLKDSVATALYGARGANGVVLITTKEAEMKDSIAVEKVPEELPVYPNGMMALMEFMARHLKYPSECVEAGAQGRVFIQFTVMRDGSLVNIHHVFKKGEVKASKESAGTVDVVSYTKVSSGNVRDLDENDPLYLKFVDEAIRVVKLMPKWTPGKVRGEPVNCVYSLPVNFRLQ